MERSDLLFATQVNGFYAFMVGSAQKGFLPIGTILYMANMHHCSEKIIAKYLNKKTFHPDIERILKMMQLGEKLIWDNGNILHYCPGCDTLHQIFIIARASKRCGDKPVWNFNHDLVNPTVDPSVKITWNFKQEQKCCHYFIIDGKINYCQDSTHELAGKSVYLELPKSVLEDWSITEKIDSIPSEVKNENRS